MTTTRADSDLAPGVHRPRSARRGLMAICLGFLMITLDATIVNVALGPIVADLGGSLSSAQWTVNGYTLSFAALLLSAGTLADWIGARRGYAVGLMIFAVGSAACSAAPTLATLITARLIQGLGAAWLMPCSLALIAHTFPETRARRRALSVWAGVSGIGLAAGPVLGGVLTQAIGWRAIFLINLPVAALALVLLLGNVAETRRHRQSLDLIGQPLAILTLSLMTAGLILTGQRGWASASALVLIGLGVVAAVAFVVSQRRVSQPMIDPILFTRQAFSRAAAIGLIFNFCLYGALFCLSIDFARGHGLNALDTGLALVPMTVVIGVTAYLSGRVVARVGEWRAIVIGLSAGLIGAILVALNSAAGSTVLLVLCTLPIGLMSLAMAAMTAAALQGVPTDRVGLASGVLNTARQTGGALGVAALGALLSVAGPVSLHAAFTAIAVAYAAGVLVALSGLRSARDAQQQR